MLQKNVCFLGGLPQGYCHFGGLAYRPSIVLTFFRTSSWTADIGFLLGHSVKWPPCPYLVMILGMSIIWCGRTKTCFESLASLEGLQFVVQNYIVIFLQIQVHGFSLKTMRGKCLPTAQDGRSEQPSDQGRAEEPWPIQKPNGHQPSRHGGGRGALLIFETAQNGFNWLWYHQIGFWTFVVSCGSLW